MDSELYRALTKKNKDKVLELCKKLPVDEGPMHVVSIHGDSVLHVALYSKQVELVEKLLDMCKDDQSLEHALTGRNAAGNTLLHGAATNDKFLPFAEKLLELQPQLLHVPNEDLEPPLFSAARYGQMKMFKFLEKLYRNLGDVFAEMVHEKDDGTTTLHAAIDAEHFELAFWIASKHQYLHNEKNYEGLTALQLLACNPLPFRFRGEGRLKGWLIKTFIDSRIKNNTNKDEDSSHLREEKVTSSYSVPWWDEMLRKRRRYNEAVKLANLLIEKDTSWATNKENDDYYADQEDDENSTDQEDDEISTVVYSIKGVKKIEAKLKKTEAKLKKIEAHQDKLKEIEARLKEIEAKLKKNEADQDKLKENEADQDKLKKIEAKLEEIKANLKNNEADEDELKEIEDELMEIEDELKEIKADQDELKKANQDELKKTYQDELHKIEVELMKGILAQLQKTDKDELEKIEAQEEKAERQQIPLLLATQTGCVEIVYKILDSHPQAVEYVDKNGRSILHIAIKYRQMVIFDMVLDKMKVHVSRLIQKCDSDGNSILHMVGKEIRNEAVEQTEKRSPFFRLQDDLLLFEHIKKVIKPHFYKHRNRVGQTAEELLALNKEALREKSQEWLKRTAENCSIIAVLIATVAFAAAYTIPGGSKSDGSPVLLNQTFFIIFTIGDVLSLTFCLTAVVIFMSILTSSYQLQEFKLKLPQKLMLGITCLLLSVSMMMLAFSATIILMIHNKEQWTKIALYMVAFLPVTVLVTVYMSLYWSLMKTFKHTLTKIMFFLPKSNSLGEKSNTEADVPVACTTTIEISSS